MSTRAAGRGREFRDAKRGRRGVAGFVPGHGFLPDDRAMTRAGLQGHRQILLDVREAVEGQIARGATEDEAVAVIDLPQYRRFQGYSTAMEMAVRRTYLELTTGLD